MSRQRQAAVLLKVDPVTTGSQHFVVASEDLDPGERINVHRHEMEDEPLILYKGVATVTLGDQRLGADAGTTVFVPTGTWIGVENTGKQTATVFFLFPEIGAEDWFRQVMVAQGEDRTPLSKEKLEELKRKHHIVFQAPNP